MNYTKTNPKISYTHFYNMVLPIKKFKSLTGKEYDVKSLDADKMKFVRVSTGEKWFMNLKGVHQVYLALTDFKTMTFKPYVPRGA